jgi:uncharacterized membrane protein (UPF0136 family)
MNRKKTSFLGLLLLAAGFVGYFLFKNEPYSTFSGVVAGAGFAALIAAIFPGKLKH